MLTPGDLETPGLFDEPRARAKTVLRSVVRPESPASSWPSFRNDLNRFGEYQKYLMNSAK